MPAPRLTQGRPLPPGPTPGARGCNFALFSRHTTAVTLLLFEPVRAPEPTATLALDPELHRTGDVWHVHVEGLRAGVGYAYRIDGPCAPHDGMRFDARRIVVDLRAPALHSTADWALPAARHPSAAVAAPGTYAGLIEKIAYLRELGVTTVELLPVQAFDPNELSRHDPLNGVPLRNYWGYGPVGFFAPHEGYAAADSPGAAVTEFKTMVHALHAAGIEVILDIVFNHSAEGAVDGPTLSMRGIENGVYYLLDPGDRSRYMNFSGCGNTVNCNHPVVRDFILDCVRYWATELRVDGFRFDLASVLGRDGAGNILTNPPLLEHIAEDPVLRGLKLIVEAWDAGGAYQVGSFPGHRWSEWNGRYRDDVRRFWRGERGLDGPSENFSANYGAEGPTQDARIESTRARQIRNFIATLMLSRGIPMLLGGDEFRRSQRGNNNAYCQSNDISWYDWSLASRHADIIRFTRSMIQFRRLVPMLSEEAFYTPQELGWVSAAGGPVDWDEGDALLGVHFHPRAAPPVRVVQRH